MAKIGVLVFCLFFATFSVAKPAQSEISVSGDEDDETSTEILDLVGEVFGNNDEKFVGDDNSSDNVVEKDDAVNIEIPATTEVFDENAAKKLVVKAIGNFRKNLFTEVRNTNQNQIMSSYSLTSALGMLLNGASGDTAKQVLSSFGIEENKEIFIQNYKLVANQLKSTENFKLNSANRVYYQHNWNINGNYTKSTKEHFLAGPEAVDFSIGEAPGIINKWVEDQTNSKIKDLIPEDLDPSTVLVLVNAIHFKGDWDLEFNDAVEDDFKVSEEKSVKAKMMTNPKTKYGYLKLDEHKAQAVEIPYKGNRISMIVILPDPESSLEELEKAVEEKGLSKILDTKENTYLLKSFVTEELDLSLPKFKMETSLDLVKTLKDMGMTNMFDSDKADFSKMGLSEIYVTDAGQKAFIEVNEEGTEAAAATFSAFVAKLAPNEFKCDRPFMFLIRDKQTDVTLFSGHVVDPTAH